MKEITAAQAAIYAGGVLFCGPSDNKADFVERDSRKTGAGSVFVGLAGSVNDGNDFAPAAYGNGCRIFLLSSQGAACKMRDEYSDASVILVEDTLKAMQLMAKNYIADLDLIRIAVTGSVGKTTTKEMLYKVFSSQYRTICNYENFNNHIGVPLTAFLADGDTQVGIFEMGMNHSGEIHLLADIIRPQTALITNVGTSHIGNLGSRDKIMEAKMEITDFMDSSSALIYNADNDKLSALSHVSTVYRRIPAGCAAEMPRGKSDGNAVERSSDSIPAEETAIQICDIVNLGEDGVSFRLKAEGDLCEFKLPLPGAHNAYNAALAAACGLQYGISLEQSAKALASMESNSVRLNAVETDGICVINDTYNASPDSVRAALDVLRDRNAARRVAILADMFELGDESDDYHRRIGRYASENGVDVLVTIGERAKSIAEGASEKMAEERIFHFDQSEQFTEKAHEIIRKGDAVLVKGSHGMAMHKVADYLTETGEWNGR